MSSQSISENAQIDCIGVITEEYPNKTVVIETKSATLMCRIHKNLREEFHKNYNRQLKVGMAIKVVGKIIGKKEKILFFDTNIILDGSADEDVVDENLDNEEEDEWFTIMKISCATIPVLLIGGDESMHVIAKKVANFKKVYTICEHVIGADDVCFPARFIYYVPGKEPVIQRVAKEELELVLEKFLEDVPGKEM